MSADRDRTYLLHILECVDCIADYARGDHSTFMKQRLVQDAVLRRLQTMAESTQRLSDDLKTLAPDVDWRAIAGFRNVLAHDYLNGIDLEQTWDIVQNYLPDLEREVKRLLDYLDDAPR